MGLFGSREEAPRARSTEEREAARRAREAQRAASRGEPPPEFSEPAAPPPAPPRTESPTTEPAPPRHQAEPTAAPPPVAQPPRREAPAPAPRRAAPVPEPVGRYAGASSPSTQAHDDAAQPTAAWDVAQEDEVEAWKEQDMASQEPHEGGGHDVPEPWDLPPAATTTHGANGNGNGASAHPPVSEEPPAYDLDHPDDLDDLDHHDDFDHHDELDHPDELGHDDDLAWHDEAATGEFAAQGYVQEAAPAPEHRPAPDPVTSSPEPEPEPEQKPARARFARRTPRTPGPPPALPARRAAGTGRAGRVTKRIGGRSAPPATAAAPVTATAASATAAPVPPPPPRGRRPLALALFLAPIVAVVWFLAALFQPLGGDGEGTVSVTIPEGASVGEIGDILAAEGVVDSGLFFRVRATLSGDGAALRSGPHDLRRDMSYASAITAISTPPPVAGPTDVVDVVIPEGLSRGEIAPIVEEAGIEGDYEEASESFEGFSPRGDFDAPEGTDTLEGFLFPATYELAADAAAEDLVEDQLATFQDNFAEVDLSKAEEANLTPYEVLIIASMVERETRVPEERPVVAAVIYNRLADGMRLGIDATIRYANDNWDSPLRQSELQEDGPYNTRTRLGLPPTPIGNPGLASIQAAANPADEDFLFYVVKPGTCGEHNFSATEAEFQQDAAEYNRARDAAGGKSPTTC